MPLTNRQIQKRWDANVQAVQDAIAGVSAARVGFRDACLAVTAVVQRPGAYRRLVLDELTADEQAAYDAAIAGRQASYEAVLAAEQKLVDAQATFKAGVPED